jgi:tight adherence protein C
MIDFLSAKLHDAHFMTMLLAAIAVSATAYTLIMPLFAGDSLSKRMKAVASERERLRQRERERLNKAEKVSLRQSPKQLVSKVVEDFNLTKWLAQEAAHQKLVMAGYRGQAPYVTFLFFRAVTPIVMLAAAVLYVFVITKLDKPLTFKIGICIGAAFLGLQAPMLFLKNAITKRQHSIKRAFPDALDLLLICIESGMSVEVAFRKVAGEIVQQSVALSEEFALTTATVTRTTGGLRTWRTASSSRVGNRSAGAQQSNTTARRSARACTCRRKTATRMSEGARPARYRKTTASMFVLPSCLFIVILGAELHQGHGAAVSRPAQGTELDAFGHNR